MPCSKAFGSWKTFVKKNIIYHRITANADAEGGQELKTAAIILRGALTEAHAASNGKSEVQWRARAEMVAESGRPCSHQYKVQSHWALRASQVNCSTALNYLQCRQELF